jgi:hypothetical protein
VKVAASQLRDVIKEFEMNTRHFAPSTRSQLEYKVQIINARCRAVLRIIEEEGLESPTPTEHPPCSSSPPASPSSASPAGQSET